MTWDSVIYIGAALAGLIVVLGVIPGLFGGGSR